MEHEAHVSNLLEVLLYHASCVESVDGDDSIWIELVDYIYRKVASLLAGYVMFCFLVNAACPPVRCVSPLLTRVIIFIVLRKFKSLQAAAAESKGASDLKQLLSDESKTEARDRQNLSVQFKVSICALTLLRYLSSHLKIVRSCGRFMLPSFVWACHALKIYRLATFGVD